MQDQLTLWRMRAALTASIRQFFSGRDFLELDTPILVPTPGTETFLRYFGTQWRDHGTFSARFYLRSSPELHLKQALAMGVEKVFHLGKCFRNAGELGPWHHPEFSMLEWYQTGIGYTDFMDQTETLIREVHAAVKKKFPVAINLPKKMERLTVAEAFKRFVGVDLVDQDEELAKKALACGSTMVRKGDDFETAFFKLLMEKIEPGMKSLGAAFLYDYPASQAALATVRDRVAERFELYINGVEVCNAFHECCDPSENRMRIREANMRRTAMGFEVPEEDQDFYDALDRGLPASCGNALGFDRLLALFAGESNLDRVVPFRFTGAFARHKPDSSPSF